MGVSVSRRDATPCALLQKEASQRQQRRSVAAPPAPGSVTAQRRKPTFRPPLPLHCIIIYYDILLYINIYYYLLWSIIYLLLLFIVSFVFLLLFMSIIIVI